MRKVILIFGLIAGAIASTFMIVLMSLWAQGYNTLESGELIGYASMVIALSMIFFGIKSYRDNHRRGAVTFGKGLQIGLLITLIASVIYAGTWDVYYRANPEVQTTFMEQYTEHTLNKMRADGASEAEIEQQRAEMASMIEMYKNPFVRFGFTLMEIVPVGIIITLISAAILRRKEILPAQPLSLKTEVG
jgi:hypothetical protein